MVNSFRLEWIAWHPALPGSFARILRGQGAIVKVVSNSGRMGQTFVTPLWRGKGRVPARSATARGPALSSPTRLSWVFPGSVLNSPGLPCLSRACSGSVLNSPIALPHNADSAKLISLLVSSRACSGSVLNSPIALPHNADSANLTPFGIFPNLLGVCLELSDRSSPPCRQR